MVNKLLLLSKKIFLRQIELNIGKKIQNHLKIKFFKIQFNLTLSVLDLSSCKVIFVYRIELIPKMLGPTTLQESGALPHAHLGCARFAEISSELTKTWSSGDTECGV